MFSDLNAKGLTIRCRGTLRLSEARPGTGTLELSPERYEMMKKLLAVMIVLSSLAILSNSKAGTIKEEYELQERCGKHAEEWFKHEYGNGSYKTDDVTARAGYTNHYNTKLNKCFVLLSITFFSPKKTVKERLTSTVGLFDINEQKEYGSFYKNGDAVVCNVGDKICLSSAQWDALIKPYMEE